MNVNLLNVGSSLNRNNDNNKMSTSISDSKSDDNNYARINDIQYLIDKHQLNLNPSLLFSKKNSMRKNDDVNDILNSSLNDKKISKYNVKLILSLKNSFMETNNIGILILKLSLKLYGFVPIQRIYFIMQMLQYIHWFLVLLCMSLGFYSFTGINNENHGSNYLALLVDFVYPFLYLSLLNNFQYKKHFGRLILYYIVD